METAVKQYREITPDGKYILNLHPGQTKAWESTSRFVVVSAGTQGGKTCFEPDWLRREIKLCGDGDYLVITATFPLLELKLLPEFRYVFETAFHLGEYKDAKKTIQFYHVPGGTNGQVKVIDPTRIIFGSATHPESVESATAKAAVMDECGQKQFRLETWEAVQRRLSLSRGRCLFGTTLYNAGWFINDVYNPALAGKDGFELVQFDSTMNPAFPREEYAQQMAKMPPWKFAMFYRGRFIRPAGLVHDSFDAADIVNDFPIPKDWLIYVGHDFGIANPAALFAAQNPVTGELFYWHEYLPGAGKSPYDHVRAWREITSGHNVIARIGGNHAEQETRDAYTAQGWHIIEPRQRSVDEQIMRVIGLERLHKIKVFRSCKNLINEKQTFSYKLDEKYQPTNEYEDEKDMHLLAAERYLHTYFTPETAGNSNRLPSSPSRAASPFGRR